MKHEKTMNEIMDDASEKMPPLEKKFNPVVFAIQIGMKELYSQKQILSEVRKIMHYNKDNPEFQKQVMVTVDLMTGQVNAKIMELENELKLISKIRKS